MRLMPEVYKSSAEWNPTAVVALAASADGSRVAAARADGSVELWLVSPGSTSWHCFLIIHGDPNLKVSSLVWCRFGPGDGSLAGRLFSSNMDGSVSEWDFINLKEKVALDSIGVTIWQIAAEPCNNSQLNLKPESKPYDSGYLSPSISSGIDEVEDTDSDDDCDSKYAVEFHEDNVTKNTLLAFACDDGCVRIYSISDADKLIYKRSLPRVSGRTLSVTWSTDAKRIYSGSSDGYIRCWDAKLAHEIYRITVGLGGLGNGSDLCIWSLIALRCETIVSADSSGTVQFWNGQLGTLLRAHSYHKGDVNALVASPCHNKVYSAGSDGQVILYNLSSGGNCSSEATKKWNYVGYVRVHTHDVRALAVAVPINHEDMPPPEEKVKRPRGREKPLNFGFHKWAHLGGPMLISAGDDTKLFAYSVKDFTKFSPHDICPAPQKMPMQLVHKPVFGQSPMLLVQASHWLDIYCVRMKNTAVSEISSGPSRVSATTDLVARVKCKPSRKIICSTISSSGASFAYSDLIKLNLFELKRGKLENGPWTIHKRQLPRGLPFAHCMVFSSDSSCLLFAGCDQKIYVVDVGSAELVHVFTPCHKDEAEQLSAREPPFTKVFTSTDGRWLSSINCFGDVYIFNLKTLRQHWFISRLDGSCVTGCGFTPQNSNILIICTSSNQVYALDVEAKQFCDGPLGHTISLPKEYQDFPGEVMGLSFPPSSTSSLVIVYGPRAMCLFDLGLPGDKDDGVDMATDHELTSMKVQSNGAHKRKMRFNESITKHGGKKNFEICAFRDPVLFVEHLSKSSMLVIDKPWKRVVENLDSQPIHRHIFGT